VRQSPPLRLEPLFDGGGQEAGLRSGTLNAPGIVGLAAALTLCVEELPVETPRLRTLRDELFRQLQSAIDGVQLNGPPLDEPDAAVGRQRSTSPSTAWKARR
jgi:cysteine desulfurase